MDEPTGYTLPKELMLTRGFSKVQANEEILNETRHQIENNLVKSSHDSTLHIINELTSYSFMLPDLNLFEDYKFKEFLQNDLIELPTQYALTESGHLNWWSVGNWENVCRPLHPMVTSGDGNCLLHAASLAMWGLHDRHLMLRKALHSALESLEENSSALWRRWKYEQMCQNRKFGLVYDDDEWSKEWQSLLKLSSYEPRINDQCSSSDTDQGVYFESLEEFHVFLLAHILQRPIIIVADTMLHDSDGEPLSPIPFGGIYLPFECDPNKCHRFPLVLAYDSAHFSPLVLMDNEFNQEYEELCANPGRLNLVDLINKTLQPKSPFSIVPITYANKDLLHIHFAYDPGVDYDWSQFAHNPFELTRDEKMYSLQLYLDIVKLQLYDPGPNYRRNNTKPTNSNGMRVNIHNVRVSWPSNSHTTSNETSSKTNKFNEKIQKFINMFKKNNNSSSSNSKYCVERVAQSTSNNTLASISQYELRNDTLFHKLIVYKNWSSLFESMVHHTSLLGVKLNLAKPLKFNRIVTNYIESANHKFDLIRREQQLAHKFQATNQNVATANQHYCIVNRSDCSPESLCNNCTLKFQSIRKQQQQQQQQHQQQQSAAQMNQCNQAAQMTNQVRHQSDFVVNQSQRL